MQQLKVLKIDGGYSIEISDEFMHEFFRYYSIFARDVEVKPIEKKRRAKKSSYQIDEKKAAYYGNLINSGKSTIKEVAESEGTTPTILRKALRSHGVNAKVVGRGRKQKISNATLTDIVDKLNKDKISWTEAVSLAGYSELGFKHVLENNGYHTFGKHHYMKFYDMTNPYTGDNNLSYICKGKR